MINGYGWTIYTGWSEPFVFESTRSQAIRTLLHLCGETDLERFDGRPLTAMETRYWRAWKRRGVCAVRATLKPLSQADRIAELEDKLEKVIWALRPFASLAKHHAADAPEWGPFDSVSAQVSIRYLRDAMITLAAVAGRYKLKGQDDE